MRGPRSNLVFAKGRRAGELNEALHFLGGIGNTKCTSYTRAREEFLLKLPEPNKNT